MRSDLVARLTFALSLLSGCGGLGPVYTRDLLAGRELGGVPLEEAFEDEEAILAGGAYFMDLDGGWRRVLQLPGDVEVVEAFRTNKAYALFPRWTGRAPAERLKQLGLARGKPAALCSPLGLLTETDRAGYYLIEALGDGAGVPELRGVLLLRGAKLAELFCPVVFAELPSSVGEALAGEDLAGAQSLLTLAERYRPELVGALAEELEAALRARQRSRQRELRARWAGTSFEAKVPLLVEALEELRASKVAEAPGARALAEELSADLRAELARRLADTVESSVLRATGALMVLLTPERLALGTLADVPLPEWQRARVELLTTAEALTAARAAAVAEAAWAEAGLDEQIAVFDRLRRSLGTAEGRERARLLEQLERLAPRLMSRLEESIRAAEGRQHTATAAAYRLILGALKGQRDAETDAERPDLARAQAELRALAVARLPTLAGSGGLGSLLRTRAGASALASWGLTSLARVTLDVLAEGRGPPAALSVAPMKLEGAAFSEELKKAEHVYYTERRRTDIDPLAHLRLQREASEQASSLAFMRANRGSGGGCRMEYSKEGGVSVERRLRAWHDTPGSSDYVTQTQYTVTPPPKEVCSFSDAEIADAERRASLASSAAAKSSAPSGVDLITIDKDVHEYTQRWQVWRGEAKRQLTLELGAARHAKDQRLDLSRFRFMKRIPEPAVQLSAVDDWVTEPALAALAKRGLDDELAAAVVGLLAEAMLGASAGPDGDAELRWQRAFFGAPASSGVAPVLVEAMRWRSLPKGAQAKGWAPPDDQGHRVLRAMADPPLLTFTRDGAKLIDIGSQITIFDARTGEMLQRLYPHSGGPRAARIGPDDRTLLVVFDNSIDTWDIATGVRLTHHRHPVPSRGAAISASGRYVFVLGKGTDPSVKSSYVFDTVTETKLFEAAFGMFTNSPSISDDGARISLGEENQTRVLAVPSGEVLLRKPTLIAAKLSPDGRTFLGKDAPTQEIQLWSVDEDKLLFRASEGELDPDPSFTADSERIIFRADAKVKQALTPLGEARGARLSPLPQLGSVPGERRRLESVLARGHDELSYSQPASVAAAPDLRTFAVWKEPSKTVILWSPPSSIVERDHRVIPLPPILEGGAIAAGLREGLRQGDVVFLRDDVLGTLSAVEATRSTIAYDRLGPERFDGDTAFVIGRSHPLRRGR